MSGALVLLPNRVAAGAVEDVLPAPTIAAARRIEHFLAENAKSARAFLKAAGHPRPMAELSIIEIGHRPDPAQIAHWLEPIAAGHDIAIVSESGCPGVADPGASIVAAAHERGIRVRPLVGPSSLLLALMASGLDGQRFRFMGYLPVQSEPLIPAIRAAERDSAAGETQIFIETPYRNQRLFDAFLAHCAPTTRLTVAIDITGEAEFIATRSVAMWKKSAAPAFEKQPTVFALLAAGGKR
ncbi:MAG: SAM-dependent methyltransferase [Burkholderiaceae bacterium]